MLAGEQARALTGIKTGRMKDIAASSGVSRIQKPEFRSQIKTTIQNTSDFILALYFWILTPGSWIP